MEGTVKRDFKVLTEKISPENIAVMAELIAMRETKVLIGFIGYHAEIAHKELCRDIFCKDMSGYTLSDSYDLVQSVALFLCDHCGKYLDDFLYISEKGKRRTIKFECYLIITRMLSKRYRLMQKYQSLEATKEKGEISCMEEFETEYQQEAKEDSLMEQMTAALNLVSWQICNGRAILYHRSPRCVALFGSGAGVRDKKCRGRTASVRPDF